MMDYPGATFARNRVAKRRELTGQYIKNMKHKLIIAALLSAICTLAAAETIEVKSFRYAGPFEVKTPHKVDTLDIAGKAFDPESALDRELSPALLKGAKMVTELPKAEVDALHLLGFSLENTLYTHATLKVEGLSHSRIFVDGKPAGPQLKLEPGTHDFVIKALTLKGETDSLKVSVETPKDGRLALREDGGHIYSLDANTIGLSCGGISVSAGGKFIALTYRMIDDKGSSSSYTEIQQASDGKVLARRDSPVQWMPSRDEVYYTRADAHGRNLYCSNPLSGNETLLG